MHDLILLHPPSVFDFRARGQRPGPIATVIPSSEQFEMYPLGLTSIAAYLGRNGYRVRIVNLGRRMVGDRAYDPVAAIRRMRATVFGIDLHWLPHAQGALAVARLVRELHPEAKILLGGLSASYFHAELLADPAVDLVLRGDSTEEPCRQLLQALREGRPLDAVENLAWRRSDGAVVVNPLSHHPVDLDAVEVPAYRSMVGAALTPGARADALPYEGWWRRPLTVLLTARGCVLDCAICGGSKSAYAAICDRQRPAFRSPERLVEDLRDIRAFSRSPVFVVHDPRMGGQLRVDRLFELLARERPSNELVFELFWPAGAELFGPLARSVPCWSLQLTIDSEDEAVRRRNGKFGVPNEAIEATIESAFAHGCRTLDVFFSIGLPGQGPASATAIGDYAERLLERFGRDRRLRAFVAPIAPFLDPGSRAYEDPALGYHPRARTLADHEAALLEPDWTRTLTYDTDAMTRAELVEATYVATERLNGLNLRYGLVSRATHDAVVRRVLAARTGDGSPHDDPSTGAGPTAPWMFAKDDMNWPGREGPRPTLRLVRIVGGALRDHAIRRVSHALGRFDHHVMAA